MRSLGAEIVALRFPDVAAMTDDWGRHCAVEYQEILLRRRDFAGRVLAALGPVDAMLIPAQPFAAPTVARMATLGQVPAQLAALIRYTAPFDMSGNPTLTLPVAFTGAGLPIAAQFVGKPLGEAVIASTAGKRSETISAPSARTVASVASTARRTSVSTFSSA